MLSVRLSDSLIPVCAAAAPQTDLREFRVGMPVSSLPQSGYGGFACAADPAKRLGADGSVTWETWRTVNQVAPDTVFRTDGADPGECGGCGAEGGGAGADTVAADRR